MKRSENSIIAFFIGLFGLLLFHYEPGFITYLPVLSNLVDEPYKIIFTILFYILIFSAIVNWIIIFTDKIKNKKNLRSFKELNEYYGSGNFIRVIKQTILTIPFYFYIKLKADEPFTFLFFYSAVEKADISYWIIIIPYLICYFLIKLEFQNTNFDYIGEKYLDKNAGVQRLGLIYGIWYGLFGWIGSAVLDFLLMAILVIRLLI